MYERIYFNLDIWLWRFRERIIIKNILSKGIKNYHQERYYQEHYQKVLRIIINKSYQENYQELSLSRIIKKDQVYRIDQENNKEIKVDKKQQNQMNPLGNILHPSHKL